MQYIVQLLQLVQQGIEWVLRLVQAAWNWSLNQVLQVPWDNLGNLPFWKVLLLLLTSGTIVYCLYRAGREILDAGKKVLAAFMTLVDVFVKTLPPILLAGGAAALGAWVINHVKV
jgi:hypothetical protein